MRSQPIFGVISRSYVLYCWPLLRFNILKIRVVIIMIEGELIFTREYRWYKFRWSDLIICYVFLFHRTLKRISPMFTFLWSDSVFHWFFWFVRLSFSSNSGNWSIAKVYLNLNITINKMSKYNPKRWISIKESLS